MFLLTETRIGTSDATLRHRQLGHLNQQDLASLVNVGELEFSKMCTASKMQEVAVPKKTDSRASAVVPRVFSYIQGPFDVASMHGARYALSVIYDSSWLAVIKYLVRKSDALPKFIQIVTEHGATKCLRNDNGGKYSSNAFGSF